LLPQFGELGFTSLKTIGVQLLLANIASADKLAKFALIKTSFVQRLGANIASAGAVDLQVFNF